MNLRGKNKKNKSIRTIHNQTKDKQYGEVHYTCCNGILNSAKESIANTEYAGQMLPDCSGAGIYNATHGLWDFVESFVNLLRINTRPVSEIHIEWNKYFKNCSEDGIIVHYCHSQGTILTRNALASYNPEWRKRIHVIAVAPAAYIDQKTCGSVMHYVSKNDLVPWFDTVGRIRHRKNITILNRHPNASWFDHNFQSPTYYKYIKKRTQWIRKNYGDLR